MTLFVFLEESLIRFSAAESLCLGGKHVSELTSLTPLSLCVAQCARNPGNCSSRIQLSIVRTKDQTSLKALGVDWLFTVYQKSSGLSFQVSLGICGKTCSPFSLFCDAGYSFSQIL